MYSVMLLGCDFSNSVPNDCFEVIFNVSGNNHVVSHVSNKFLGRLQSTWRKARGRISFCCHAFCQFMDLFLKLEKQFGHFRYIHRVIWTCHYNTLICLFLNSGM